MKTTALLLSAIVAGTSLAQTPQVFHGRQGGTTATMPRLDSAAVIDGVLDDAVWRRAAVLTGFSGYLPLDNRPAADSTGVLLYYTERALYVGIRAFESHGEVHATLAARDRIESDDYVQILLDPFNDRRRAFVFGVNPLGAQADGIRTEGSNAPQPRGQTFGGNPPANIDLNPDYVFESKGRVIDGGYEVEVSIPLKSIRFQGANEQKWALQVLRFVQHSGYQQTWTPARRGSASFLVQSGTLIGIHDLRRDQVVEINPELTEALSGAPKGNSWDYKSSPAIGANLRWRFQPNLTLNATVHPDFSQVEADAAQIAGDTRFALFFPEKRPFFVDGSEQFETPNNLIYTRRIVQPEVAVKLSGRIGRTNLAFLSAVDGGSGGADNPIFNIIRLRRDILTSSTLGIAYTDRIVGSNSNRVLAADSRIVFRRVYAFGSQLGVSRTVTGDTVRTSPLFDVSFNRSGYKLGMLYSVQAFSPGFQAQSGFLPRNNIARVSINNRYSFYGQSGDLIESYLIRQGGEMLWRYGGFLNEKIQESKIQLENVLNMRGGWILSVTPVHENFRFPATNYANYRVARATDTVAFVPSSSVGTAVALVRLSTPQWRLFTGKYSGVIGRDVDFFEAARAKRFDATFDVDIRPSARLRLTPSFLHSSYWRSRDGTLFSRANVPRLKAEYQISKPLFLRFVGQYDNRFRDALRDPRTERPIVTRGGTVNAAQQKTRDFRVDWLVSFVPSPGTVVFAGYGASLTEPESFRFQHLERVRDGFFLKLSYLLRR